MHVIMLVQNVGPCLSQGEGRRDEDDAVYIGPLLSGEESLSQKPLQSTPLRSPQLELGCMAIPH